MATIKGSLIYRNRKYKYRVYVFDIDDSIAPRYDVEITNPVGDTRKAWWNFKTESLEQAVIKYILSQVRPVYTARDLEARSFSRKNKGH